MPVTYITNKTSQPTLVWFDKDASERTTLNFYHLRCTRDTAFYFVKFIYIFIVLVELDKPVEWIKFNVDQVGYYRVNYRPEEWETLRSLLRYTHKVKIYITLPYLM